MKSIGVNVFSYCSDMRIPGNLIDMMSKSHIVIGIASAMTLLAPCGMKEALPVIAGGAIGSLICDPDCKSEPSMKDALYGRVLVIGIIVFTVLIDIYCKTEIWNTLLNSNRNAQIIGILLFLLVCVFVRYSAHRGFSHSFLALILEAAALQLVMKDLVPAFVIAFISHLGLDVLDKKPVQLLFPLRMGFCLRLFYADRIADKVVFGIGCLWLAVIMKYTIFII